MYTPRQTNLKFKILFEEDPVTIAIVRSNNISILFKFIYIFLRESSRKICSKTHKVAQLTRHLHGEYAPIPLNIVCTIIHYLLFFYIKMNIFTILFLQNFSKIFSKTHQIAPFLKIFSGEHAPEPP